MGVPVTITGPYASAGARDATRAEQSRVSIEQVSRDVLEELVGIVSPAPPAQVGSLERVTVEKY